MEAKKLPSKRFLAQQTSARSKRTITMPSSLLFAQRPSYISLRLGLLRDSKVERNVWCILPWIASLLTSGSLRLAPALCGGRGSTSATVRHGRVQYIPAAVRTCVCAHWPVAVSNIDRMALKCAPFTEACSIRWQAPGDRSWTVRAVVKVDTACVCSSVLTWCKRVGHGKSGHEGGWEADHAGMHFDGELLWLVVDDSILTFKEWFLFDNPVVLRCFWLCESCRQLSCFWTASILSTSS